MSQENLPLLRPLLLLATLLPATLIRSVETNGAVGGAAAYMQRVSGRGYPAADIVSTQLPVPSYATQLPVPSYAAQLPVPSYAAQLPVPSYAAQLPVPSYAAQLPVSSYAAVTNDSEDGRKPDSIANPQRSVIQEPTRDTWSELMTKVSQLIKIGLDPYVSFFEEYPLHLSDTLDTVRSAITNSRIAENPALAAAMGTAAVALPLIFQISRSLLENTVSLLDNSMFVATGHGLGRRSLDEDIYDEIADILLRIVNLVTRHLGK